MKKREGGTSTWAALFVMITCVFHCEAFPLIPKSQQTYQLLGPNRFLQRKLHLCVFQKSQNAIEPVDFPSQCRLTAENGIDATTAGRFQILTCSSSACSSRRKYLRLDEFATFSAFYARVQDSQLDIQVRECPCLGACKAAPCVAIEHENFLGPVALQGMSTTEFSDRVFHRVTTEDDADRVWQILMDAIRFTMEQDKSTGEGI